MKTADVGLWGVWQRSLVVCRENDNSVIAYYTLAAGALSHDEALGSIRRNMPSPIPVIVLGRFAVDLSMQDKYMGASLLQEAIQRAQNISMQLGARALLVHAIDDNAKRFYLKYGFVMSPIFPYTLMCKL